MVKSNKYLIFVVIIFIQSLFIYSLKENNNHLSECSDRQCKLLDKYTHELERCEHDKLMSTPLAGKSNRHF